MFADTYTAIHSVISLIALALGLIVLLDLFGRRVPHIVTAAFLLTAILTSVTGFGFPFSGVRPSHVVGALALVTLAGVLVARYVAHLSGGWRAVYVIGIVVNVFFLVFVTVAQAFNKISALHALAPTQSEPPFAIAETVVLAVFIVIGIVGMRRYTPPAAGLAAAPQAVV